MECECDVIEATLSSAYAGIDTPINDPGSCWAFNTLGAMEAACKIKCGTTLDLSEQYLASCITLGYGATRCNF